MRFNDDDICYLNIASSIGCTVTIKATRPSDIDIPEEDELEQKVIKQRNLVSSKMDEKNLKKIEDKFAELEKELGRIEQAEMEKLCPNKTDYLEQNKNHSVNYQQIAL